MTDKEHEGDLKRVSEQNSATDFTRSVEELPSGGLFNNLMRSAMDATPFGHAMRGRTSFEGHRLNAMIDLVEQTNPEDLESSGKALWDARDAITDAAKELDGHIGKVHWVGESGEAFRTWGRSLVTSTYALSDYAGGAGDQITAAAVGLAAVRKAMPPRDTRPEEKALLPKQLPAAKQVDGNAEYAAAVRVEKDRQEAINQMNRLSSYYAVAHERLATLEPPQFTTMPNVGVPKPAGDYERKPGDAPARSGGTGSTTAPQAVGSSAAHTDVQEVVDASPQVSHAISYPHAPEGVSVGTNIDSVGTLPAPTTMTPTPGYTPPGAAGPALSGYTSVPGGSYVPQAPPFVGAGGKGAAGSTRAPVTVQGRGQRAGSGGLIPGRTAAAGQGPLTQSGKPVAPGQFAAKGTTGGARSFPMGSGVTGGTPRAGGTAAPRAMGGPATGAGRANGVVGGRPTSMPPTSSRTGRQIPRGTVVGSGETARSRGTNGRPMQRGVVGVPQPSSRPDAERSASSGTRQAPTAVTSQPAARNSATAAARNGLTRGGLGLRRGPGGQGGQGSRRTDDRTSRSDQKGESGE